MKLQPNNTESVINFRQFLPAANLQFLEPMLRKLSKLAHENRLGILTLDIAVMICCIILGLTILMIIKQEIFSKPSATDQPLPRPAPPMLRH
jgi:hypothetical protein